MNYPTSLDDTSSLPNPGATDKTNSPSHAGLHSDENAAIIALETKIGISSSTPVTNRLLFGTGTGTSAWTQLTSAQLAASVSDETGTGSVVFQTSPTLNTPKVDTINENTPANGVTIDSLNIKDGKLNTNSSVVTANITDGAVTNAKLSTTAGEVGGAWLSWTPTFTNFSLGNGTINTAKYTQVGKTVRFKIRITLGSTSSVSGVITMSMPVTAASDEVTPSSQPFTLVGIGTILDSGTTQYSAYLNVASTTTLTLLSENAASTSSQPQNTSATVPMTWATSDAFYVRGSYEAA